MQRREFIKLSLLGAAAATAGSGLGRYLALNFINGAQILDDETLDATPSFNGFVGIRHWWNEQWLKFPYSLEGLSADEIAEHRPEIFEILQPYLESAQPPET